jgi:hypothetical protein
MGTARPAGATNAIGCTAPARGGGNGAGAEVTAGGGGAAGGRGSSVASNARASGSASGAIVAGAAVARAPSSAKLTVIAPSELGSSDTCGRAAVVGVTGELGVSGAAIHAAAAAAWVRGGTGAGRGVRQLATARVAAAQIRTYACRRLRRMPDVTPPRADPFHERATSTASRAAA